MLIFNLVGKVIAVEPDVEADTIYEQQIQDILSSNTLTSEKAFNLSELFYQNSSLFLHAVSAEESDFQNMVICYLLLANNFGATDTFLSELNALSIIYDSTSAEFHVLQKIYSFMNSYHEEQTRLQPAAKADYGFSASTILKMIESNLYTSSVDESFFDNLADAYLMSPSLFSETIAHLSVQDVQFLAKAISYSLQKTGRSDLAVIPNDCNTQVSSAVSELLYKEIVNAEDLSIEDFVLSTETSILVDYEGMPIEPLEIGAINIYSINFSTHNVTQYGLVRADISFGTYTASTSTRLYTIKVYSATNPETLIVSKGVSIPANNTGTSVSVHIPLNNPGSYSLIIKIYDSSGALVASRTSATISVTAVWEVLVILPQNRDNTGVIYLYNGYGSLLCYHDCLGKSASGDDPMVYYGNTPTGTANAWLEGPHEEGGYGPNMVIAMEPTSGQLLTSKREGILVHGGSGEYLAVTNGCIRVTDTSMLDLQDKILSLTSVESHAEIGSMVIIEQ